MRMFLQIVAFSLQTDGRPVLTKRKAPLHSKLWITGMKTLFSNSIADSYFSSLLAFLAPRLDFGWNRIINVNNLLYWHEGNWNTSSPGEKNQYTHGSDGRQNS